MKVAFAFVALAAVALAIEDKLAQDEFRKFLNTYNKQYSTDEVFARYNIFKDNLEFIMSHDAEATGYSLAVNEFTDLSWEEFSATYKGYNHRENDYARSLNKYIPSDTPNAATVDWRTKGAVTPIKNQAQCGSCWAFSTTGSIEGANQIATGKLISLSEQQLVDCAGSQGNQGCNGGLMDNAFEYVIKNGGLDTEADYAYTARDGACNSAKEGNKNAPIKSYKDVQRGSESDLESAVNEGPVSIAIEADQRAFQSYSSGVFDAPCGKQLDHGVLAVGYGSDGGKDYWIVKNSWGTTWGAQGYIWLVKGQDECGLADAASIPHM